MREECEKGIFILQKTRDGDDLDPADLYLLQCAVNNQLNERGKEAFHRLFLTVEAGEYRKPWLHGVENLTRDHEGYVYWKGEYIEHFTYHDKSSAAYLREFSVERLGPACRAIEGRGGKVTWESVSRELDKEREVK